MYGLGKARFAKWDHTDVTGSKITRQIVAGPLPFFSLEVWVAEFSSRSKPAAKTIPCATYADRESQVKPSAFSEIAWLFLASVFEPHHSHGQRRVESGQTGTCPEGID
jgi:hypothetical protein